MTSKQKAHLTWRERIRQQRKENATAFFMAAYLDLPEWEEGHLKALAQKHGFTDLVLVSRYFENCGYGRENRLAKLISGIAVSVSVSKKIEIQAKIGLNVVFAYASDKARIEQSHRAFNVAKMLTFSRGQGPEKTLKVLNRNEFNKLADEISVARAQCIEEPKESTREEAIKRLKDLMSIRQRHEIEALSSRLSVSCA